MTLASARADLDINTPILLAFKRENFVYSRTKNSHFSMCPFRGCSFTYGKKTSLLHVPVLSYFEIVEIISPNTREIIWSAFYFYFYFLRPSTFKDHSMDHNFSGAFKGHLYLGLFSTFCWQTTPVTPFTLIFNICLT